MMRKRSSLRVFRLFVMAILCVVISVFPFMNEAGTIAAQAAASGKPQAPKVTESEGVGEITTWSCIWLGSYLQSEITENTSSVWQEISKLKEKNWDAAGDTVYENVKYHRVYVKELVRNEKTGEFVWKNVPHYYRLEPIKWRVLSINGNDALVVSDKVLDCKPYNMAEQNADGDIAVTWETCTLRSWLNGYGTADNAGKKDFSKENFINTAFTGAEQAIIRSASVPGMTNPETGVSGGNATTDKLFLLSASELTNKAYGFGAVSGNNSVSTSNGETVVLSRVCANTGWAVHLGAVTGGNIPSNLRYQSGWYWMRLPGKDTTFTAFMSYAGNIDYTGTSNNTSVFGVRPAMHVNLKASSGKTVWKYAGTVNSMGQADEPEGSGADGGSGTGNGTGGAKLPAVGTAILDSNGRQYRILTSTSKSKTVMFTGLLKQKQKLTIPAAIKYSGYTYNVVSIDKKVMQKDRKLTTLTIGKNVKTIGKQAFYGCKKLKNITIKTSKLTTKSVKKNAFKGIAKKAKIKVPAKKVKSYKKLLRARGVSGKAKIRK